MLSIGITLFVIFIVSSWILENKRTKKRRTKILQDYYEATNTIAYQESLGISLEEKVKLIEIIRLYIMEFMNKNVFDIEKTAHFIGYIQRDCIKLSQAFLLVDRFMAESRQSVLALQSTLNLNKLIRKLDAAEIKYKEGLLSDIDFQRKVENIVLGLDEEKTLLRKGAKIAAKIALSSVGLNLDLFSIILEEL